MKRKFLPITHKTLDDLGAVSHKELWEHAKSEGYDGLCLAVKTDFEKNGVETNKFHAIFSTDSEDRHGDIVKQKPDLRMFKKNPVLLDSHNYDSIEHIIGRVVKIKADEKEGITEGDIEFFLDNPKGALAARAAEQGFLSATSIGFIPRVFDDKGTILEWELLEISAVSVPAQAEALFERTAKSFNGKITLRKTMDEDRILCFRCDKELAMADAVEVESGMPKIGDIPVFMLVCAECATKQKEPDPQAPDEPATPVQPLPSMLEPKKITAASVIARMAQNDKRELRMLAKAVGSMVQDDRNRSRRKLLKAIRSAAKNTD